ncbi:MAG: helix-turn-helix domain-containing protein [Chloroflexi bacterium]|nr:helix-turn-helix domain-containing protein [Chloroflexota bacterium]
MRLIYARELTKEEREILQQSLKSSDGFRVRRAQMILMSADEHLKVAEIGRRVGCQGQAVRVAIHAFHAKGVACLEAGSHARHGDQRAFDEAAREQLRRLTEQSPREWGYATSLWTLDLLARVSFEQGLTDRLVTGETVRATLKAMGITWQRAKHWITSPDANYTVKKTTRLAEGTG